MKLVRMIGYALLLSVCLPAAAHADPITAAGLAISTSLYSATGVYVSAAMASFVVQGFVTAAGPATRSKFFGKRDAA